MGRGNVCEERWGWDMTWGDREFGYVRNVWGFGSETILSAEINVNVTGVEKRGE